MRGCSTASMPWRASAGHRAMKPAMENVHRCRAALGCETGSCAGKPAGGEAAGAARRRERARSLQGAQEAESLLENGRLAAFQENSRQIAGRRGRHVDPLAGECRAPLGEEIRPDGRVEQHPMGGEKAGQAREALRGRVEPVNGERAGDEVEGALARRGLRRLAIEHGEGERARAGKTPLRGRQHVRADVGHKNPTTLRPVAGKQVAGKEPRAGADLEHAWARERRQMRRQSVCNAPLQRRMAIIARRMAGEAVRHQPLGPRPPGRASPAVRASPAGRCAPAGRGGTTARPGTACGPGAIGRAGLAARLGLIRRTGL